MSLSATAVSVTVSAGRVCTAYCRTYYALVSHTRRTLTSRCPKAAGMMFDSPECAHDPLSLSTLSQHWCWNIQSVVRVGIAAIRRAASSLTEACNKRFHVLHKVLSVLAQSSRVLKKFERLVSRHRCQAPYGIWQHAQAGAAEGGPPGQPAGLPTGQPRPVRPCRPLLACARPWLRPELGPACRSHHLASAGSPSLKPSCNGHVFAGCAVSRTS